MIIGAAITCAVFYFIQRNREDAREENISELLAIIKQKQASGEQLNAALSDSNAVLNGYEPLTVIVSGNNEYFYFHGKDCSGLEKTGVAALEAVLGHEKEKYPGNLMIIIKKAPEAEYKNSIELLEAISRAGIEPGQYAELALTAPEINCIKNYKKP